MSDLGKALALYLAKVWGAGAMIFTIAFLANERRWKRESMAKNRNRTVRRLR